jgi:hypothetical protein
MVTVDPTALRMACCHSSRHSDTPLARATIMNGRSYTSMRLLRSSRAMIAAKPQPSAMDGRISALTDPVPSAGRAGQGGVSRSGRFRA